MKKGYNNYTSLRNQNYKMGLSPYTAKNHFLIKKKILNLRNYFLKRETDFLNKKNGS
jgi:hypothetical protein